MTAHLTGRRNVIMGAGVVAGAGALAACSSPPVPSPEAPRTSSPAVSPSANGGDATPGPGGTPVSEIPVGGGRIFPDQQVVVTQPAAGEFKAFSTTCTHQGCAVTAIEDGHIICPCHRSQFDLTSGAPTPDSQAKQPLAAMTVHVEGDRFILS